MESANGPKVLKSSSKRSDAKGEQHERYQIVNEVVEPVIDEYGAQEGRISGTFCIFMGIVIKYCY